MSTIHSRGPIEPRKAESSKDFAVPQPQIDSPMPSLFQRFIRKTENFLNKTTKIIAEYVLEKEKVKKNGLLSRTIARSERLAVLSQSEAYNLISTHHYPVSDLENIHRKLLKELASMGALPERDVHDLPPKRIREMLDLYSNYISHNNIHSKDAPLLFKASLEKIILFLRDYEATLANATIRGDEFELNFTTLEEEDKFLLFQLITEDKIIINDLTSISMNSIHEQLIKLSAKKMESTSKKSSNSHR